MGEKQALRGTLSLRLFGQGALIVAVLSLLVAMAVLVREGLGRAIFNSPGTGVYELIGLLLAVMMFSALPMTLTRGPEIEVTLLYRVVPSGMKRVLDLLALVARVFFYGSLLYVSVPWAVAATVGQEHTPGLWAIPSWPPKVMFPINMAIATLYAAYLLVELIRGPLERDAPSLSETSIRGDLV